jgi:hypothetical protein
VSGESKSGAPASADQALVASQSSRSVSTEGFDPSRWQPIETAPHEEWINTILIARDKGNRKPMAAVFDGENWRCLSITGMQIYVNPTHWMPLPDPPEERK